MGLARPTLRGERRRVREGQANIVAIRDHGVEWATRSKLILRKKVLLSSAIRKDAIAGGICGI